MKIIFDKYSKILLISLLIIAIVYFLIPKYQIFNNSGSIYKLNKITGQVTREYIPSKAPEDYGIKKPAILLKP